ncbi:DegV family protein [Corynebacterium terpenotabidum]|uniref:DegV family protein n=1 Tax=Corynebacterium terpenotabidum Y-11 TaxID=1200352 RepID=S4XFH9_9CORY|nr:hypothetical protein A606_03645 [Corynebacterium terpenotabidum Y-11]
MTVYVVTDSTACLPPALAAEYGITVLEIHTSGRIPATDKDGAGDAVEYAAADVDAAGVDPADPTVDGDADTSTGHAGETAADETASEEVPVGDTADDGSATEEAAPEEAEEPEEPEEPTTAGLGALELTAAYARLLERGGDDGVVAVHLSRELSSTWSAAMQAAGVFHGLVEVLDTGTAGMSLGQAAIAAARCAAAGGTLAECAGAARLVLDGAEVWLYVHRLDAMARGGRLSTAQRLLSTALAIKPILHLNGGKIELAAKTRTQSKAMARMVSLVCEAYRRTATPDPVEVAAVQDAADTGAEAGPDAVADATAQVTDGAVVAGEVPPAEPATTTDLREEELVVTVTESAEDVDDALTDKSAERDRSRIRTFGGDHEFRLRKRKEERVPLADLPRVPMHLDIHQAGCPEIAEQLRQDLREKLPDCVVISVVDLSPALIVHTGPEAVGITFVRG